MLVHIRTVEASMQGLLDKSGDTINRIYQRWGIGVFALPVLLAIALVGLAMTPRPRRAGYRRRPRLNLPALITCCRPLRPIPRSRLSRFEAPKPIEVGDGFVAE
jgi:hypothetical protein